ncbi:hypothetical protein H0A70_20570 [Alcaligenaceae bacterium]|nr:hypothetical protein [Alcaligenaceae bacterium]
MKAGKLRPLAVLSDKRIEALPDVPTLAELGFPAFEAYAWQGLVVSAGTPEPVVARLNTALNHALNSKEVTEQLEGLGIEPTPSTSEELAQQIRQDEVLWQPIVRSVGVTLD